MIGIILRTELTYRIPKSVLKMIFLFPFGGICWFSRGYRYIICYWTWSPLCQNSRTNFTKNIWGNVKSFTNLDFPDIPEISLTKRWFPTWSSASFQVCPNISRKKHAMAASVSTITFSEFNYVWPSTWKRMIFVRVLSKNHLLVCKNQEQPEHVHDTAMPIIAGGSPTDWLVVHGGKTWSFTLLLWPFAQGFLK